MWLKAGTIDWSIKDAHIYVNQIDGIKEQIERYETKGSLPAPTLQVNPEIDDFYAFDASKDIKDIRLENYEHMGKIRFPLAQQEKNMKLTEIAAIGKNRELGKDNQLIWHFPQDLKFFQRTDKRAYYRDGAKDF